MYREHQLIYPRYDLFLWDDLNDDYCEFVPIFADLLGALGVQIDAGWLRDKFFSYHAGEGDLLVFHRADDAECFISIDCFCDYTDQMDMVGIGVRAGEAVVDVARAALENLGRSGYFGDRLFVQEVRDDRLKLSANNYENFILEQALDAKEEQEARRNQSFSEHGMGYLSLNSEASIKRAERLRIQKHQPIHHYVDGAVVATW